MNKTTKDVLDNKIDLDKLKIYPVFTYKQAYHVMEMLTVHGESGNELTIKSIMALTKAWLDALETAKREKDWDNKQIEEEKRKANRTQSEIEFEAKLESYNYPA